MIVAAGPGAGDDTPVLLFGVGVEVKFIAEEYEGATVEYWKLVVVRTGSGIGMEEEV